MGPGQVAYSRQKIFFSSLMQPCTDSMPHSQFYYPGSNNQMSLIEALANGINIICNEPVSRIGKEEDDGW